MGLLCLLMLAAPVHAARVINSVTLDGGATTTVTPGSTVTVSLTVTTSGNGSNDDWDSTSYTLNGVTTCVNTPNHNGDGTYTESFTVTVPAAVGSYSISFYAHRNGSCNPGSDSNNFSVSNGIVVATATGTSCPASFPDGVSSSSASGSISFGWGSRTTSSPDNILDTTNLVDNSGGVSCDISACSQSGSAVSAITYSNFPGGPAVSVGFLGSQTLAPGDYSSISVGTFATLQLSAGDYTVSGNLSLGYASNLVVSGSGTVRIHVNGTVTLSSQADANNPGSADQLVIFSNGNVTLGSPSTVNGFIYSNGSVTANNGAVVTGAVTASSITLQSASRVNYDSTALAAADFGSLCTSTPPVSPTPLLEYRFDEASWSGVSGEVLDSSGNSYDGTSTNGAFTDFTTPLPAIPGDPGTCRYGEFDGGNDYVAVPTSFPNLTGSFTITAWIYARDNTGDHRIFADDQSNSGGYAVSLGDGTNGSLRFFNRSVNPVSVDTPTNSIALNTWYHIAAVHDASGRTRQIYINGVAQSLNGGGVTSSYTGTWGTDSGPVSIGSETNASAENGSGFRFNGMIDEVRVYSSALSQSQIDTIRLETHPCSLIVLDHYLITAAPTAVTCEPLTVTVSGVDGGGNAVDIPSGTQLIMSTDIANDGWSSPAGSGATYTVPSDTPSVDFELRKLSPATVEIDVDDNSGRTDDDGIRDDDFVTFADAGLSFYADGVVNNIGVQVSGKPSSTAPNSQTITVKAVQSSPADPAICEALIVNTTADIGFAYRCDNPGSCATANDALTINSTTVDSDATTPYTDVSIAFDGAGVGTFTLEYRDAGYITLLANADWAVSGATGTANLQGGTNSFLVKPAGLCVRVSLSDPNETNSHCSDATCANAFYPVDTPFDLEVSGRTWATTSNYCDDATHDTTGNFVLSNIALSSNLVQPASGVAIAITPTVTSIVGSTGYVYQPMMVSEVGVLTVTATPPLYNGELLAVSTSGDIGRFTPHHYVVESHSITPAINGLFTYLGQPFTAEFNIRAVDSGGTSLENYIDAGGNNDFTKLDVDTHISYGGTDGTNYYPMPRLHADLATPAPTWGTGMNAGEMLMVSVPLTLDRASTVEEAPITNVAVGLQISDSDGIQLDGGALDIDTELPAADDRQQLGSVTEFRFGRVFVPPVYGPEIFLGETTPIPFVVQYWDGATFVTSIDDSSTVYDAWTEFSCTDGTVACADVSFGQAPAGATVSGGLSDRSNSMTITRPGAGKVGDLLERIEVDDWLKYDWSGSGTTDENPSATIHFGRFRGHDRIIYWREVH